MLATPPLSLYIHIPWCVRKCPYCDFNSHEAKQPLNQQTYIDALLLDLDDEIEHTATNELHSIFIGGGTPSLFSADAITQILEGCKQRLQFSSDIEITMEANPGTFEQERFNGFKQAGVNRLSIGIQSFDAAQLQRLGRIHNANEARTAVNIAQQAGFDNINLDLMFALPEQSIAQAIDDVTQACSYNVQHISHYQLTIEANTYFHKHPPVQPDSDSMWEMQTACQQVLAAHGYAQYEVSAYAKVGQQSQHNINYWQFGDYIGIGAGAHGKLTDVASGTISRRWKKRQPEQYMRAAFEHDALSGSNVISEQERLFEFLLNALRLREGVTIDDFVNRTGMSIKDLQQACKNIDADLLTITDTTIRTTEHGYRFVDEILQRLL